MKIIRIIKYIINAAKNIPGIVGQETYYPECKRKGKLTRIIENIRWVFKYREANIFYNSYKMDIKGVNPFNSEYIDYRSFMKSRTMLNTRRGYSYNALLRDKLLFFRYMKIVGIPVPDVLAVIFDGNILDLNFQPVDDVEFYEKKNYFVKDIDGECASCVVQISDFDELIKNKKLFSNGRFIIQEAITQHSEISKLYSHSVNTIRLITVMDKNGTVQLFSNVLRIGTTKSGNVDNGAKGGLGVGIQEDGRLEKYGFYKPQFGSKVNVHPDSKMEFSSFKIPFYNQAVELACFAHKYFYGLHSIGWDVAITENGCIFIEGNDNWEITFSQICCGGLRKKWYNSAGNYIKTGI